MGCEFVSLKMNMALGKEVPNLNCSFRVHMSVYVYRYLIMNLIVGKGIYIYMGMYVHV